MMKHIFIYSGEKRTIGYYKNTFQIMLDMRYVALYITQM